MVKPIAVFHGMASAIETKLLPPYVRDELIKGSVEGLYWLMYISWEKLLISTLSILIHFVTSFQLDCPEIDGIALPSRAHQVVSSISPSLWRSCVFWLEDV
jgi:hypothetical protein